MINITSGIRSQIKQLKDRLKGLNTSKHKPSEIKSLMDDLEALEKRYEQDKAKREEKKKLKETTNEKAPEKAEETVEATKETPKQENVVEKESADVVPEMGTNWPEVLKKKDYKPLTPEERKKVVDPIVDKVEKSPSIAPHIISKKFNIDDLVKPARGSESIGRVMRCEATDENPAGLVYVYWDKGALAEKDKFGGYYAADLQKHSEQCNCGPEKTCPVCVEEKHKEFERRHKESMENEKKQLQSDLKQNYDDLLKDLKEERELHYQQGNHKWVSRLDDKIKDLESKIQEKFPKEASSVIDHPSGTEKLVDIDKTPSGDKAGVQPEGKDSRDEAQDMWAQPDGRDLESKLPPKKERELDALVQQAVYGYQINIMDMGKVHAAGEAAYIKGEDVTTAVHTFLDSLVASGRAMKTASLETEAKNKCPICNKEFDKWPEYDEHRKKEHIKQTASLKLSVFKNEWSAVPVSKEGKFAGYDVSDANGKRVLNINPGKEISPEQLQFLVQAELTRGLKQAKLVDKIAFLEAGSKVYVLASSKDKKQVKIASLEHSARAWVPASKVRILGVESKNMQHGDHSDKVLAMHETEWLVECPTQGVHWAKKEAVLPTIDKPISQPPATPESLNTDVTADKKEDCPYCGSSWYKPEENWCPTCIRHPEKKEALRTQLPNLIPDERAHVNAATDKKARGCDQCEMMKINGVPCHEPGCPRDRKPVYCGVCGYERTENDPHSECEIEGSKTSSLNKKATVVHRDDGWHVLSEKGKNLGGPYKTKGEAVKRLRQVEFYKSHKGYLVKSPEGKTYKIADCNFDTDIVELKEIK